MLSPSRMEQPSRIFAPIGLMNEMVPSERIARIPARKLDRMPLSISLMPHAPSCRN